MKQFFILSLVAGVLMVSAPSQARQVSTRSQCLASCGTALSDTCGWITRRGKYNACRNRLIRQCRRWGVATMCPAPPPPPTTTVPPPPTTTTTTTYVPPTTTSTTYPLPPPPVYPDLRGNYEFYGYVTIDNCVLQGNGSSVAVPFSVTGQSGTDLLGTHGADGGAAWGTYTPSTGGWNLGESYYEDGCLFTTGIGVGNDSGF